MKKIEETEDGVTTTRFELTTDDVVNAIRAQLANDMRESEGDFTVAFTIGGRDRNSPSLVGVVVQEVHK